MVPRLSLPATTRLPSTTSMRNDSHFPRTLLTSSFFCLMSLSMRRLLPMVPTMMLPLAVCSPGITADAVPLTLRTSSPKSWAARITPFQSCSSTTIAAALPSLAIQNRSPFASAFIVMNTSAKMIVIVFFINIKYLVIILSRLSCHDECRHPYVIYHLQLCDPASRSRRHRYLWSSHDGRRRTPIRRESRYRQCLSP